MNRGEDVNDGPNYLVDFAGRGRWDLWLSQGLLWNLGDWFGVYAIIRHFNLAYDYRRVWARIKFP